MAATVTGIHLGPDTHANRPAANAAGQPVGALYSCTTHSLIYKTDGSSWSTYATLGSVGGTSPNDYIGTLPYWVNLAGTVTLTANRATFVKVVTGEAKTVTTAYFRVSSQAGNIDIGIYDSTLATRLGSTGSFSCPATGNRSQAFTGSIALSANTVYYIALAGNNASTVIAHAATPVAIPSGGWNLAGRMETAFALPSSITPIWEDTAYVPYIMAF